MLLCTPTTHPCNAVIIRQIQACQTQNAWHMRSRMAAVEPTRHRGCHNCPRSVHSGDSPTLFNSQASIWLARLKSPGRIASPRSPGSTCPLRQAERRPPCAALAMLCCPGGAWNSRATAREGSPRGPAKLPHLSPCLLPPGRAAATAAGRQQRGKRRGHACIAQPSLCLWTLESAGRAVG